MLKNSLWSMAGTIGIQVIATFVNLILARMLYPELFGVLGIATVFGGLVLVLQEAGLSSYLIYQSQLERAHVHSAVWLNVSVSCLLALVIVACSGIVSNFYVIPELRTVFLYMAIGLFVGSFGIVSRALLMKEKRFKTLAVSTISVEIVSGFLALVMVWLGQYLLAISFKLLFRPVLQSLVLIVIKHRDLFGRFRWQYAKQSIRYSKYVLGAQLLIYLINNAELLIIGKMLGSRALGLYTIAFQWSVLAKYYISRSINRVLFPGIAEVKDRLEMMQTMYLNAVSKLASFTFPLCIGLCVVTPEFIAVLYGQTWLEAIPIMQYLMIAGAVSSIGALSGSVFQGTGKPDLELRLNAVALALTLAVVYLSSTYGMMAVAAAVLLRTLLFELAKSIIVMRMLSLRAHMLLRTLLPCIVCTLAMAACTFGTKLLLGDGQIWVSLSVQIIVGMVSYAAATLMWNREIVHWLRSKVAAPKMKLQARS